MKLKTIKISEKGYGKLSKYAGELQANENKPISLNDAMLELLEKEREKDITRFAGKWQMTDAEVKKIKSDLGSLWKTWKTKS